MIFQQMIYQESTWTIPEDRKIFIPGLSLACQKLTDPCLIASVARRASVLARMSPATIPKLDWLILYSYISKELEPKTQVSQGRSLKRPQKRFASSRSNRRTNRGCSVYCFNPGQNLTEELKHLQKQQGPSHRSKNKEKSSYMKIIRWTKQCSHRN